MSQEQFQAIMPIICADLVATICRCLLYTSGHLECSDICVHLPAAPDVARDGFAFGLRHRAVHRNHKFAVRWKRVDILFFEKNSDPKLPKDARIIDAVKRIAGEPLNGLCKDEVDLFLDVYKRQQFDPRLQPDFPACIIFRNFKNHRFLL